MVKTYSLLRKIEMTEEQNAMIAHFLTIANKYDINEEISEIYLSMIDVTGNVLNEEFCPIIFINGKRPSNELYEGIREESSLIPEYVHREEDIPANAIILWGKGEK